MMTDLFTYILGIVVIISFTIGFLCGAAKISNEALENNVAYYSIDAKTGVKTFNWVVVAEKNLYRMEK